MRSKLARPKPKRQLRVWTLVATFLGLLMVSTVVHIGTAPASAATGQSYLYKGEHLKANDYLISSDIRLTMQGDGNLVQRRANGTVTWQTRTGGHPGAKAVFQHDGNFVIYHQGRAIWQSRTAGNSSSSLRMSWTGKVTVGPTTIIKADQTPRVRLDRASTLKRGERLSPGQKKVLVVDQTGPFKETYTLSMQHDGNLVLRLDDPFKDLERVLWNSRTNGNPGAEAVMQHDGNFVIYHQGRAIWHSRTNGNPGAVLTLSFSGDLGVTDSFGYYIKVLHDE